MPATAKGCAMRREGSPFQGLGTVLLKELSDHLTSARMRILEWLVVLTAMAALYGAIQQVRDSTAEDPFLFLRLFTVSRILAQPIYRDALLMGKFLGGLVTLAISLIALWLLVVGLGLFLLGQPPGAEEMARSLIFLLA